MTHSVTRPNRDNHRLILILIVILLTVQSLMLVVLAERILNDGTANAASDRPEHCRDTDPHLPPSVRPDGPLCRFAPIRLERA